MSLFEPNHVTSAIRFWEQGRIAFNLVLTAVVVWSMGSALWHPSAPLWIGLGIAAGCANVLYSSAYVVDLLVQVSGYREGWRRWGRFVLWTLGTAFAVLLTIAMAHPAQMAP
jgi:hypothetical protein